MFFGSLRIDVSPDGFQGGTADAADEVGPVPELGLFVERRQVAGRTVQTPAGRSLPRAGCREHRRTSKNASLLRFALAYRVCGNKQATTAFSFFALYSEEEMSGDGGFFYGRPLEKRQRAA